MTHDINGHLLAKNINLTIYEYNINSDRYNPGTYLTIVVLQNERKLFKKYWLSHP
ncbi:MAG: hypothetical protein HRT69_03085 [Flavobacteriaceae bacterium]|nr:hypothetical protein [Flavobacteriaceae bacterium]